MQSTEEVQLYSCPYATQCGFRPTKHRWSLTRHLQKCAGARGSKELSCISINPDVSTLKGAFGKSDPAVDLVMYPDSVLDIAVGGHGSISQGNIMLSNGDKGPLVVIKKAISVETQRLLLNEVRIMKVLQGSTKVRQMIWNTLERGKKHVTPKVYFKHVAFCLSEKKSYVRENTKQVLVETLVSLQDIHSRNVFHGDIKPNNILLTEGSCKVQLCDFGSAVVCNAGEKIPWNRLGCRAFAAPEYMLKKHSMHAKGDVYSLGVTFLNIFMGNKAWKVNSKDMTKLYRALRSDDVLCNDRRIIYRYMSPDTWKCLEKMIASDVSQRCTVDEVLTMVRSLPASAFTTPTDRRYEMICS